MILLQLYIDGVKADLDDTSIKIINRIKDSKDPATLFTAYTHQFVLKASKTNNKIFKHYHDENVVTRFDARIKTSAVLKLNGADKYKGYIKLNGVDLEDNSPRAYRIQFFGELTSLKDRLGEDMLEDLAYTALTENTLNKYNHPYTQANVKAGFEDSLVYSAGSMVSGSDGEIIYPFISHTRQFEVSSSGLHEFGDNTKPLDYVDLKPALQVKPIFDIISEKYSINFAGDFLDSDLFKELFLWLHRNKGYMVSTSAGSTDLNWLSYMDDLDYDAGDGDQRPLNSYYVSAWKYARYEVEFEVAPVETGPYDMFVYTQKSNTFGALFGVTGTNTITLELNSQNYPPTGIGQWENIDWNPLFLVHTESGGIVNFTPTITVTRYLKYDPFVPEVVTTSTYDASGAVTTLNDVIISEQVPKMKIIDFIRGVFKMFNLVAYERQIENSGEYEIVIVPLDEYYAQGKTVDITKYVDISNSSVERVAPYKTVNFQYTKPSTFLIKNANEISGIDFGNEKLTLSSDLYLFDGGDYKLELPFEKMMYERFINTTTEANTELIWGWFVDDQVNNPEPALGAPLLFLKNNRSCATDSVTWAATGTSTTFNAASNVSSDELQTIHFGAENDEFEQTVNENSLFANYHSTYIQGIFDSSTRRKKVTAYLPPRIILNSELNDKIVISGVQYQIDSISTNLSNGKTQLELLRMSGFEEKYNVNNWVDVGWVDEGWVQ